MDYADTNELTCTVPADRLDEAVAIATLANTGGLYIEDYRNLEQAVAETAHVDLIDEALLQKDRTKGIIHLYLPLTTPPAAVIEQLQKPLTAAGIPFTFSASLCRSADWANAWKQYYKPMPVGRRLLIQPAWEAPAPTDRLPLLLEPGLAFGTGTHETTRLCLELLDENITGGERMLDVGCGSGILSVAALLLGAGQAVGVDIDPLAVKVAEENAARNGVANRFTARCGNCAEQVTGTYEVVAANIVADVLLALTPTVLPLLAPGGLYLLSGIIDEREAEVLAALQDCFRVQTVRRQNGWSAVAARRL